MAFFGVLFGVGFVVYFLLKASSTLLFHLYKLFFGVKNVDCSITNQKINIGQKEIFFNNETKKLTEVKLCDAEKKPYLEFKGIEQKENKTETKFTHYVVVPNDALYKAEQVVNYFKINNQV